MFASCSGSMQMEAKANIYIFCKVSKGMALKITLPLYPIQPELFAGSNVTIYPLHVYQPWQNPYRLPVTRLRWVDTVRSNVFWRGTRKCDPLTFSWRRHLLRLPSNPARGGRSNSPDDLEWYQFGPSFKGWTSLGNPVSLSNARHYCARSSAASSVRFDCVEEASLR